MTNVKELLEKKLQENKNDLAEFNLLNEHLKKYEGKPINKRVKLPEGWEFEFKYGMTHAIAPSGNRHLIGYNSDNVIKTGEWLEKFDACYCAGAKERIEKIEGFLLNGGVNQLTDVFSNLERVFIEFKQAVMLVSDGKFDSFHNPVYYDLLRSINLPANLASDIRFEKLNYDKN